MIYFCDFIQVYVFSTNHHLNFKHISITRKIPDSQCLVRQQKSSETFGTASHSGDDLLMEKVQR